MVHRLHRHLTLALTPPQMDYVHTLAAASAGASSPGSRTQRASRGRRNASSLVTAPPREAEWYHHPLLAHATPPRRDAVLLQADVAGAAVVPPHSPLDSGPAALFGTASHWSRTFGTMYSVVQRAKRQHNATTAPNTQLLHIAPRQWLAGSAQ